MKKDRFKEKRKALEVLASQGVLFCEKHEIIIGRGLMYKKRCYTGRNRVSNQCPYLRFIEYDSGRECRR